MLQKSSLKTLVSAKRSSRERLGLHSWHPYYAGYSEAFVASAIDYLGLNQDDILLDPWHGSGTTALVASKFKILTIGCEINPVMNIFATSKNSILLEKIGLINKLLRDITEQAIQSLMESQDEDPLLDFMSRSLTQCVRTLYRVIDSYNYPKLPLATNLLKPLKEERTFLNSFEALFKAALFITARKLGGYKGGSNPTWIKTLPNKPEYCMEDVVSELSETVNFMIQSLKFSSLPILDNTFYLSLETDSRRINIHNNSIDGIITSPPYLTRIDYAMSTRPELLIISNPSILRKIREKTIGAPVIVDKNIQVNSLWGTTCVELLENVNNHTSKAARSYYLPNMLQYFRDIELSVREILRVLKPTAQALIVVQSSYFKEHEINLGQIYVEICKNLGVHSVIVNKEAVRNHMAHVNTKSNKYKSGKIYCENVILVTK
jgi:hypothetical protein